MTNRSHPAPPEHETREESRRRYEAAADASLAMFEKAHPMTRRVNRTTHGHAALNSSRNGWPIYQDSRGNLWSACGSFLGQGTAPAVRCEDFVP